jgi:Domain of unknown function (DUF4431)
VGHHHLPSQARFKRQRTNRLTRSLCRVALAAGCILATPAAMAARECVLEHDPVSVSGELHRKRFPAPDAGGRESAVILKLQSALCVMLPDDVTMQLRPRRIKELQLVYDDKVLRASSEIRHVDGTLLLANTSHHHLPVILEVSQISPLPAKRKPRH